MARRANYSNREFADLWQANPTLAEKPYLIRIEFAELFGLADVKWINEKLLFIRPWWGRIAATDLIYDVEAEKVIHSEGVRDAYLAFLQYRESCPLTGCECIKKKLE